jgi:hypothetical protein
MRQTIKKLLWVVGLVFSLQSIWAFSLLGPSATYPGVSSTFGDAWQQEIIGFNPILAYNGAPPYLGPDALAIGPKNIGEGYRRNTPVIYYAFDRNFSQTYFGVAGEQAVVQAFDILNALTNVDSYSSNLVEFPLQSQSQNYRATTLGLQDLKSTTLAVMMEQMGLADSIRYVWVLHNRYHVPGDPSPCPNAMDYLVTMRNFDIMATPLNQLQYSAYVNDELYTYFIPPDLCDQIPSPPDADAVELPADPLVKNQPVASGGQVGAGSLGTGFFYTGLTRDDVGGLRTLYTSSNRNIESVAPNSTPVSGGGLSATNISDEFVLTTSNLTAFVLALRTNNPAALQTLYPGLVISSVISNFNGTFTYTFANVVTNTLFTNSTFLYQIQTTKIAPLVGTPYGSPPVTNTTTKSTAVVTNIVSGDFFLIPTNLCGLEVLSILATNVTAVTNFLGTVTNTPNSTTTIITSTNLVIVSTNHTLLVAPCEFVGGSAGTNSNTGNYEGIESIQFVRVPDQNIDPEGNFYQPITNTYTMMVVPPNSSQATPRTFQRVLTQPDILFSAADLLPGPSANNDLVAHYGRNITFNLNNIQPNLAGPGTIDPPSTITFNKVGPVIENYSLYLLSESAYLRQGFIWGSFDGSTNDPIVYPNGTSIATLESEALIQISPATLPDATNGVSYSVTLSVAGGQPPYTWMLATNSPALPTALNLSSGGVISGNPTESGTFDFTVQMNDSGARSVQMPYSITIH